MGKNRRKDAGSGEGRGKGREHKDLAAARDARRAKGQPKVENGFVPPDDADFGRKLAPLGLRVKEVQGDGNCLFRSLADQIYGVDARHGEIRGAIVEHLEAHAEHFRWFIEDDETWEAYLDRMGRPSEWGGHPELYAASQRFDVELLVHQHDAPALRLGAIEEETADQDRPVLHVSYHGEMHYNSAVPLAGPQPNFERWVDTVGRRARGRGGNGVDEMGISAEDAQEEVEEYRGDDPAKVDAITEHMADVRDQDAIRALNALGDDLVAAVEWLFAHRGSRPGGDGAPELSERQQRRLKLLRTKVKRHYDKQERERIRAATRLEKLHRGAVRASEDAEAEGGGEASEVNTAAETMKEVLDI